MSLSENRLPSMWWLIIIFTTKIGIVRHPSFSDRPSSHISWIYLPMILQINLHFIISLHRSPLSPHAISPWLDHMEGLPFYGSPVVTIGFNTNSWSSMTTGWFLGATWQKRNLLFFYPIRNLLFFYPILSPSSNAGRATAVFAMLRAGRLTDHRFDGNGHGGHGSGLGPRPRHWLWQIQLAAHGLELSSVRGFVTAKPRQKFGDHRQNCGYLYNIYIYISTDNWKCTSK